MIAGFSLARKQPNKVEIKHLLLTTPHTADLLRKHGGKTSEELKSEGKMKHLLLTTIAAVLLVGCGIA
jgi:hypothetical protein